MEVTIGHFGDRKFGRIRPLKGKGLVTDLKAGLPGFVSSARAAQDASFNLPSQGVLQK